MTNNYAYIENGVIVEVLQDLPESWRNVSNLNALASNEPILKELGWYKIYRNINYNPNVERLVNPRLEFQEDGLLYELWDVEKIETSDQLPFGAFLTEEQKAEIFENDKRVKWQTVRQDRDTKMREFEWRYNRYERQTRMGVTPTDTLETLDAYMQALADITNQEDPFNIVWPEF